MEFSTHASLQAAISAGPIDIGDNIKIVVEERRKTGKSVDKNAKPGSGERRATSKSEEGRPTGPKKSGRAASGAAAQKSRAE